MFLYVVVPKHNTKVLMNFFQKKSLSASRSQINGLIHMKNQQISIISKKICKWVLKSCASVVSGSQLKKKRSRWSFFLKKKIMLSKTSYPCANSNERWWFCIIPKNGHINAKMGAKKIVWVYAMIS